ncbi:MAG: FAD-binding oxidoreductase, partial [Planctomycetaceae bacterium]|nr:FAD-binding oxidoreductase [Planctomycetaceae bacterium]
MIFQPASAIAALAQELAHRVAGDVSFEPYQRALYSTDASMYRIEPLGVVVPRTAEAAAIAVTVAARHGVPIIPRGSGTSLSGQPLGAAVILDCSKYLNRIHQIDVESSTAWVEAGVVLDQLNAAAGQFGLQFGPDVATSNRANLGGMIGNNSAGSRSILHGKTVNHVIELDVILADGTRTTLRPLTDAQADELARHGDPVGKLHGDVARIVAREREEIRARFPPVLRRVSGYNLDEFVPECGARLPVPPSVHRVRALDAQRFPAGTTNLARLVVGAEGTLAVVVGAKLHLVPVPQQRALQVLEFSSLEAAIDAVGKILPCGPSAIELFDRMILDLAAQSLEYRHYLDFVVGQPEYLLLAEFSGETAAAVRAGMDAASAQLAHHAGLTHTLVAWDREQCEQIWKCRKAALPLLMGLPGHRKPIAFVEDTAVNPARLPEFVARFRQILRDEGTDGAFYGHASVGCLHIRPLIDTKDRDDLARMERILTRVSDLVLEFEGSMSGEHGDGLARGYLNEKLFGPRIYQAFKEVKHAFDPGNLLNPGKIVDSPAPTENLRLPPGFRTLPIVTTFDFSRQGGLGGAA